MTSESIPRQVSRRRRILSALGDRLMIVHAANGCPWVCPLLRQLRSWTLDADVTRLRNPPQDPPGTGEEAVRFLDVDSLGSSGPEAIAAYCARHPDAPVIAVGAEPDEQRYLEILRAGAIDHIDSGDAHQLLRALLRSLAGDAPEPDKGDDLDSEPPRSASSVIRSLVDLPTLREMDQLLLEEALRRNDGIVTRAARILGLTPQAIHNRRRRAGGG